MIQKAVIFLCFWVISYGCVKKGPDSCPDNLIPFSESQKIIADKIISCFENSTPEIQYSYIENLDDGRGYTAGRAGFTTATGDLLLVVQLFTDSIPDNQFSNMVPILTECAENESEQTEGLENLPEIWKQSCNNSIFISCQDYVADSLYYNPAVVWAKKLGLHYPLSLLAIYDAIIQHGEGDDPDGLPALINRTNSKCGGNPKQGIKEWKWLETFLDVRKNCLKNPYNKDTQEEWQESVDRVKALDKLRKQGNFLLDKTIEIEVYGDTFSIK